MLIILISSKAISMNSSSYLVANMAVNLLDFDMAHLQFSKSNIKLSESDLHKKMLTFVSLDLIDEAKKVSTDIIELNQFNQEAWIVYLTNAKIQKTTKAFTDYKKIKKNLEMELLDFIFFKNNGEIKGNNNIARSILEIVQASTNGFANQSQSMLNYRFLLFYLSIANILDSDFNETYYYSAYIYQELKNYSKAEIYYNNINSKSKLYIDSQKNIAINKNKEGSFSDGENILINLMDLNKNNFNIVFALADLYRVEKKYEQALEFYTKIINSKNNYLDELWKVYYLRGICYERLNMWGLAEKDFLFSLKIKSNSPQVLNYLAYGWLERNQNIETAIDMLKKAYKKNPESHHILDRLAWAYYKNNNLEIAMNLMEKVIEMAPGEIISLDHLADIYYSMNRKREAVYYWMQVLDLANPEDKLILEINKKLERSYEE